MEETVLCACSGYEQKFYWNNDDFEGVPDAVKDELKIACVLFTEDVGGIISILFTEEGEIVLRPEKFEDDILYDDIAAGMKTRQLQSEKRELWEQLEAYYRAFVMGEC